VEILQIPALGFVKASFILFYRRIFTKSAAKKFNWVTWFMLFVIVSWTIAFFFALVFICGTDFSAYWTSTIVEKANCVDTSMLHNAFVISDVVTDVIIIVLPLPMVSSYSAYESSVQVTHMAIDLAAPSNDRAKDWYLRNFRPRSCVCSLCYDWKGLN